MGVAPRAASRFAPARTLEQVRPLRRTLRKGANGNGLGRVLVERPDPRYALPRARLAPRLLCWTISGDGANRAYLGMRVHEVAARVKVERRPAGATTAHGNPK